MGMRIKMASEFRSWLEKLSDKERGQIENRLARIRLHDHFGDAKHLDEGLCELRWKNGIRVYFYRASPATIVILTGGKKNAQKKDIKKARVLHRRYSNLEDS